MERIEMLKQTLDSLQFNSDKETEILKQILNLKIKQVEKRLINNLNRKDI